MDMYSQEKKALVFGLTKTDGLAARTIRHCTVLLDTLCMLQCGSRRPVVWLRFWLRGSLADTVAVVEG